MNPIITVIIAVAACLLGGIVGYTYLPEELHGKEDRPDRRVRQAAV